jgi:hypothetical protein
LSLSSYISHPIRPHLRRGDGEGGAEDRPQDPLGALGGRQAARVAVVEGRGGGQEGGDLEGPQHGRAARVLEGGEGGEKGGACAAPRRGAAVLDLWAGQGGDVKVKAVTSGCKDGALNEHLISEDKAELC